MKDFFSNKKKLRGNREFLYILPFLILVLVFSYYPLYGWVYAFFDSRQPASLSWDKFVGLKWFKSMVENDVKLKQLLMVIRNTFAMSGISLLFSWFPMIFAIGIRYTNPMTRTKIDAMASILPCFKKPLALLLLEDSISYSSLLQSLVIPKFCKISSCFFSMTILSSSSI